MAPSGSPLRRRAATWLRMIGVTGLLLIVPAVAADTPLTLTVGAGDLFGEQADLEGKLRALKETGATSVQTYVYWNKVEPTAGVLDWSAYDPQVRLFRKLGLRWVPFIVMSPWYVTPEHVRQSPGMTMYRCLEHGRDSQIPSIWSPALRDYVRHCLGRLADHYRPMDVLESVNLGISGDYGEAIYPVIGNWPGAYHSHSGYWCGDALAEADFRRTVAGLYPAGIAALNRAWKSHYGSLAEVRPFLPGRAPSERAWQEFLAWYRGAMTAYADDCLRIARECFPDSPIYLCTGGDMAPEHGSDFFEQARVAAKHRAGVRITNEASSFPYNVRYTRMVDSACRHYGAYFGHEPASVVTPAGAVGRVFNAVTSGANQLFAYYGDEWIDASGAKAVAGPSGRHLQRLRPLMRQSTPLPDVAIYHSNLAASQVASAESSRVAMWNYGDLLADIRNFIDYDLVDDRLVADGAIERKSILLLLGSHVMDAATTRRIEAWVRRGGVLFVLGSRPTDWDGSTAPFDALVGFTPESDEITGLTTDGIIVPQPEVLPSIASLKNVICSRAYLHLTPDAAPLITMAYGPKGVVAWRRKLGSGSVYAYYGPMDIKQDAASWVVAQRLPLRFMRDGFQACIADRQLRAVPPSLNLDVPDIYKVMTDSGLWVLNMGAAAQTIDYEGTILHVPALDILHHPAARRGAP